MPSIAQAQLLVKSFQHSFHELSQKDFWPSLRKDTQYNRLSQLTFNLDKLGNVGLETVPLSDVNESLAAAYARKFISGGDTVYLKNILEACEGLLIRGAEFDEARSIFEQLIEPKWRFRVHEGKAIGMFLDENTPVWWGPGENLRLEECAEVLVSLKDITEVTFNEGMLHAFEPKRNEELRAVIRTVYPPLRKAMSNVALAGTIYVVIVIHQQIAKRPESPCSANFCMEKRILDAFAAPHGSEQMK
ncbi:hypothetical protein ACTXJX_18170 [Glutamicibacter ardleyensis]|uniref:hypothetical protein n=1 Tax=Glutamicibacter ardleyensis TaxID=225894 RepID=UPI003FD3E525